MTRSPIGLADSVLRMLLRSRDHVLYRFGRTWLSLLWLVGGRKTLPGPAVLAIDSGAISWQFIDYEELLESAVEYMGPERVLKIVITDREKYVRQVLDQLRGQRVSHYFFDPRSASERPWRSLVQAFGLASALAWHGITPISRLTDVHHRRLRAQTTLMSALGGTTVVLMHPRQARQLAVHRHLVGPLPMPLSSRTLALVRRIRQEEQVRARSVVFVGSLYEPRRAFLNEVGHLLSVAGVNLDMRVREAGGARISNDDYWRTLAQAEVIVSTSTMSSGPGQDRVDEAHLIYRFTEACAVGRPLVTQAVPGAQDVFKPNRDFAECSDAASAADVILNLLEDAELRERVAESGARTVAELVGANYFWSAVDNALGGELSNE